MTALRLAKGEPAGRTGQYPVPPDMTTVARHPYYGDLNTIAWLLTLPNHYSGHLDAFDRGMSSAL